jgi:Zn-dependent protease
MDFDISTFIRQLSISIVPFLMAITVHEASHGYAAYFLGDDTAKRAGRLTFNPIAHIDIFGLLFLLVTRLFGWDKPVPVNFFNLRHKYGPAIVAAAGPVANFILAIVSALLLHLLTSIKVYEGSMLLKIVQPIAYMLLFSVQINVALGIFNLLPILPLDGGRILSNFLPRQQAITFAKTERYGFIIILLLVITNTINVVIMPVIRFVTSMLI